MASLRVLSRRSDQLIVAVCALLGVAFSLWLWRSARTAEEAREELAFSRQVEARHALIRHTVAGYEDCLVAMRVFMIHGKPADQEQFAAMARTQLARHPGFLGLQWAPRVDAAERVAWEAANRKVLGAVGRIRERGPGVADAVAGDRPAYYPMIFAEPFAANRHVIGSDAAASPLRAIFADAAKRDTPVMSGRLKLVYETGASDGIVMVSHVPAVARDGVDEPGREGFLLGVFRTADLLAVPSRSAAGSAVEVMFVDEGAKRPDRRVLYVHRAADAEGPMPSEEEFLRSKPQMASLQVAGRSWCVLYRNAAERRTSWLGTPAMALVAGLVVSGLGVSLLISLLRRTRIIQHEVQTRTAELSESRRQLSTLMNTLPGMAFRGAYDDTLKLTFVSEGALALTGYEPAEFLSGRIHLRDLIHADDLERVRASTRSAIEERRSSEEEYRIRPRAGGEKWVLSRGRGVQADGGQVLFEGLLIDITSQKDAEAAHVALERRALEGQKLESLGLLAGGIAHDFNNLLSTVMGNSELARLYLTPAHPAEAKLRAIESAAVRAADLCRQMLAYAGKSRVAVESADLSALTEEMVPLLRVSNARLGGLRLDLARGLPPVAVDATQIRQIVMNLVLNAAEAIPEVGGEIVLTTGLAPVTAETLLRCAVGADRAPGDYVFLEVRDNGMGMAPEVLARIFDPFFTTKPSGRGLGLSATLGIVRAHAGALSVTSAAGAGSTFRLLLPPATGGAVMPAGIPAQSLWQWDGRVLVVDDQMQVRFVMAEMLRSFGLTPVEAADGPAAIAAYRENPESFDLVVLDLIMPNMSGEQTIAVLRSIDPRVKVLCMSGCGEDDVMRRLAATGPVPFLGKPFTRTTLERELRAILES